MSTWILIIPGAVVVSAAVAILIGQTRETSKAERMVATLVESATRPTSGNVDFEAFRAAQVSCLPLLSVQKQVHFVVPDDAVRPYASPIRGVLSGLPPATVITAGFDPLHDEGKAYADALGDAGVPVKYLPNAGMIHGFMWLMGAIGHARGVFDEAGRHLRAAFAPPPSPSTLPLP